MDQSDKVFHSSINLHDLEITSKQKYWNVAIISSASLTIITTIIRILTDSTNALTYPLCLGVVLIALVSLYFNNRGKTEVSVLIVIIILQIFTPCILYFWGGSKGFGDIALATTIVLTVLFRKHQFLIYSMLGMVILSFFVLYLEWLGRLPESIPLYPEGTAYLFKIPAAITIILCLTWVTFKQTNGMINIFRDSSQEMRLLMGELSKSEQKYRTLIESSQMMIMILDPDKLQIRSANGFVSKMLGYSEEELLKLTGNDISAEIQPNPMSPDKKQNLIEKILNGEAVVAYWNFRHKNGDTISGRIMVTNAQYNDKNMLRVSGRDATNEIDREKVITERNRQLEIVINNIDGWVAYVNTDLKYELVNENYAQAFGFTAEEVTDKHLTEVIGQEIYDNARPRIAQVLSGEQVFSETQLTEKDGSTKWFKSHYYPFFNENRDVDGYMMLALDTTQAKEAETLLRRTETIEGMGLVAGGIAHDFNNLLVAIIGQNSLAKLKLETNRDPTINIDKAIKASERASKLTQQMLAFSGRGQFQIESIPINALIKEQAEIFADTLPTSVTLDTNLLQQKIYIDGDETQLQQMIMNLVINASQAITRANGLITISTHIEAITSNDKSYSKFTGKPLADCNHLIVSVSDNGDGMSPDTITRIFDPFFTTKSAGNGLGLAAVLGIVRGHKGGLTVESDKTKGTTFKLAFPVSKTIFIQQPKPQKPSAKPATNTQPADQAITILIIDDDPRVAETAADILALSGYESHTALSGETGIQIYQNHSSIDLVILDLTMGGMDGRETHQILHKINPRLPVIISSGYDRKEIMSKFSAFPDIAFLKKPYTRQKLISIVEETLTNSQQTATH